jgi:hypothetical protein
MKLKILIHEVKRTRLKQCVEVQLQNGVKVEKKHTKRY